MFTIGQKVYSKPVGCVPKFKGVIVGMTKEYIVRDEAGNEWSRHPRELFVPGRKPKHAAR
jgi:hypothetical protein